MSFVTQCALGRGLFHIMKVVRGNFVAYFLKDFHRHRPFWIIDKIPQICQRFMPESCHPYTSQSICSCQQWINEMIPLIIVDYYEINTGKKNEWWVRDFIIEEKTVSVVSKQGRLSRWDRKRALVWPAFMNRVEGEKASLELDRTVGSISRCSWSFSTDSISLLRWTVSST